MKYINKINKGFVILAVILGVSGTVSNIFGKNKTVSCRFDSRIISPQQTGARALAEKALARFMEGNSAEAKVLANQALNLDGNLALGLALRGRMLLVENKDVEAQNDLEKAVRLSPNDGIINSFLAAGYDVQNMKDLARQTAEKTIQLLGLPKSAMEYYARANAYSIVGKSNEAISDLTKAIEINPRFAAAYYKRGYISADNNQIETALADYKKSLEINPQYAEAYFQLGYIYYAQKQYTDAIVNYTKTIELNPKNLDAYINRGVAYKNSQQYEAALADYRKALELNPKDADTYQNIGNLYLVQKQYDTALPNYSKAIELNPKLVNAYLNRGYIYNDFKQQFDLAIADFTKAVELDPKNISAYQNRSISYMAVGKTELAKSDRQKIVALGGTIERIDGNAPRSIYPQATFDAESAKNALAIGNSTIRGRACSIKEGMVFNAANVRVSLYPVTPYFDEWYKLRDKEEDKKTGVYMSSEAAKYRVDVVTDGDGKFQFNEMKPGKYFLQAIFSFNQAKTATVYDGRGNNGDGSMTDYYHREDYLVPHNDRIEKFVEIKKEGDTVNMTMSKGFGGLLRKISGACSTW